MSSSQYSGNARACQVGSATSCMPLLLVKLAGQRKLTWARHEASSWSGRTPTVQVTLCFLEYFWFQSPTLLSVNVFSTAQNSPPIAYIASLERSRWPTNSIRILLGFCLVRTCIAMLTVDMPSLVPQTGLRNVCITEGSNIFLTLWLIFKLAFVNGMNHIRYFSRTEHDHLEYPPESCKESKLWHADCRR